MAAWQLTVAKVTVWAYCGLMSIDCDDATCLKEPCRERVFARGMCKRHYGQWYRAKNKDRENARKRLWESQNPEQKLEWQRRHYHSSNEAKQRDNVRTRQWHAEHPGYAEQKNQEQYTASLAEAQRLGYEWTGWELELLADRSRTAVEIAHLTQRTTFAVRKMRSLLYKDPRIDFRAGISSDGKL